MIIERLLSLNLLFITGLLRQANISKIREGLAMVSVPQTDVAYPFIEVKSYGKPLVTLNFDLKVEVNDTELKLGQSNIQVIDETSILKPLADYIDSIKQDYQGRKDWLNTITLIVNQIDLNKDKIQGKLAFIQMFTINKMYRKRHMTKPFLWLILKALKEQYDVDFVLLEAFPVEINQLDKKHFEKEKLRLEKIYSKSGFMKRSGYMYMDLRNKSFTDFT
jgi:hypothetical protein